MKEKFTKGEWLINRDLDTYEVYAKEYSNGMCFTDYVADVYERDDAHLIAAAPKMYAKLEEVYKQCMATYGSDYMDVADLLAEARGEL